MGAVDTTYTFTATDTITSAKMNNIIDQTTVTTDAIIGTTLDVTSGKLKIRSAGITSNEMGNNSVTTSSITDASVTPTKLSAGGPNWTTSTTSLGNAVTGSYTASVAPARTGDGATAIQLGAQTGVSSSASMTRNSGVDGTLEITNTGTGAIALSASGGVNLGSGGVTFGTANMPNPSGTAPVFGTRAWVNFNGQANSDIGGTYTRSGTTSVTITATAHGLIAGNQVFLDFTVGSGTAPFDGVYEVATVVDVNSFTVVSSTTTASTGTVLLKRKTIRANGNVSCVSAAQSSPLIPPTSNQTPDNGYYIVNFSIAMSDSNFAIVGVVNQDGTLTSSGGNDILGGFAFNEKCAYITTVSVGSSALACLHNSVMVIR